MLGGRVAAVNVPLAVAILSGFCPRKAHGSQLDSHGRRPAESPARSPTWLGGITRVHPPVGIADRIPVGLSGILPGRAIRHQSPRHARPGTGRRTLTAAPGFKGTPTPGFKGHAAAVGVTGLSRAFPITVGMAPAGVHAYWPSPARNMPWTCTDVACHLSDVLLFLQQRTFLGLRRAYL